MKATFANRDFIRNNRTFFVYILSGTPEELAQYKAIKGEYYREGDNASKPEEFGKPLWFALDYYGEECIAKISKNNNVYADTSEMRKMASLAKQYGANLGDAIAQQLASQLLGNKSKPTPAAQQPDNTEHTSSAADIDGL